MNDDIVRGMMADVMAKHLRDEHGKKRSRFAPPTHDEVAVEIEAKGYKNITPDEFVSFYGSKGWMIGKNKMSNWKLALARANKWGAGKSNKKTKLFPIAGKVCGVRGCGLPAVYKTQGEYAHYKCCEHMPDKVKELYE